MNSSATAVQAVGTSVAVQLCAACGRRFEVAPAVRCTGLEALRREAIDGFGTENLGWMVIAVAGLAALALSLTW